MSPIWILAVLFGLAVGDRPYAGFKVVRVVPKTHQDVDYLRNFKRGDMEVDFWSHPSKPGNPVEINLHSKAFVKLAKELKSRGIKYEIFLEDVQKAIDEENQLPPGSQHLFSAGGFDYAKYNRLSDINAELSNLANQYSSFLSKFIIGKSYENRNIYAMKIQSQKGSSNKKTIFMDCGIHAREWITPATCMYMLKKLSEKYSARDPEVTQLVKKYDWIILPVFNVDGYEYTHTTRRLWRKTRSDTGNSRCPGADPNRNWNFKWGETHFLRKERFEIPSHGIDFDLTCMNDGREFIHTSCAGVGTSSNPCSDTYHGRSPFSEIEVLSVAKYLYSIRRRLVAYYNIHAYSQLWMTPWSYTTSLPSDYSEIKRVADIATRALASVHGTSYRVGPPSRVIYSVAGGSIDWTYGVLGVRYSYALELRDKGQYGFILPASQIIPTGEETLKAMIAAAKAYR